MQWVAQVEEHLAHKQEWHAWLLLEISVGTPPPASGSAAPFRVQKDLRQGSICW